MLMKRAAVIKKIREGARRAGVDVEFIELTRHTGIICGSVKTTLGRHSEIPELHAETIYKQLQPALGKGWWRK
jgi:multimeric flavodoxin WrbA